MLGASKKPVHILSKSGDLPTGISVGEALTMKDITAWVSCLDKSVFLAGAASFFSALLSTKYKVIKKQQEVKLVTPVLFVSGTTYQKNVDRRKDLQHLVSYMPSSLFSKNTIDPKNIDKWADGTLGILSFYDHAMLAIGNYGELAKKPKLLKEKLSAAVHRIMNQTEIKELLIEGGATAYRIIQELGLVTFTPTEELSPGVVRMKAGGEENLHLTIKPGSYDWPKEWHFN
jgi:D-threonate/D-erythronate kinase